MKDFLWLNLMRFNGIMLDGRYFSFFRWLVGLYSQIQRKKNPNVCSMHVSRAHTQCIYLKRLSNKYSTIVDKFYNQLHCWLNCFISKIMTSKHLAHGLIFVNTWHPIPDNHSFLSVWGHIDDDPWIICLKII